LIDRNAPIRTSCGLPADRVVSASVDPDAWIRVIRLAGERSGR